MLTTRPVLLSRHLLAAGHSRAVLPSLHRPLSTATSSGTGTNNQIKIVEVGPRDGLQNEKTVLSAEMKIKLIEKLVDAGIMNIEAGSFVSPKWVPQMATSSTVLSSPLIQSLRTLHPSLSLPMLVPNPKGLETLFSLVSPSIPSPSSWSHPHQATNEISIFVSASEAFSHANLNCSIEASLVRLEPVVEQAKKRGIRVRGYVSVVVGCPFEGKVDGERVREISKRLVEMGCYEVCLADTIGVGTPSHWRDLLDVVRKDVAVEMMGVHCHDTYGTAVACTLAAVDLGIRTVDSSIAGLGGCPYSPGATGNVSTEDVVYALESSGFTTGILPVPSSETGRWDDLLVAGSERANAFEKLVRVGDWVVKEMGGGKRNESRAGSAVLKGLERRAKEKKDLKKKAGKKEKVVEEGRMTIGLEKI